MLNAVHKAVLAAEVVKIFSSEPKDFIVDGTVGAAGHARLLVEHCLSKKGKLIGFDRDGMILKEAKQFLKDYEEQTILIHENYSEMKKELKLLGISEVGGILLDLGVSSLQLDNKERGFSIQKEGPLDMRMDVRSPFTAYDVLNGYEELELKRVFREFSDIRNVSQVVKKIIKARTFSPLRTTADLASLFSKRNWGARQGIHPATLVFQAIRIEVNGELEALKKALTDGFDLLAKGGIFAIISFHSLEDRLVKNFFKEKSRTCFCPKDLPQCVCSKKQQAQVLTKKPIIPSEEEKKDNKRARSAKLRVLCRL